MRMTEQGRRWYVVQTQPHAELRASSHLRRQGFEVYLPRYSKLRRHARKVDYVARPLFPRYLFVAFDKSRQYWHGVRSTIGVTQLVGNGDGPSSVPDEVVQALRRREGSDGLVQMAQRAPFSSGETIQVVKGAFSLCIGRFESMSDRERVSVLLDLLGRSVRVFLDLTSIAAVQA